MMDEYIGTTDENGLPHGRGTITFADSGTRFEGRFVNGEKSGRGCFYFPDGSNLAGLYVLDMLEGRGIYNYSSGRKMVAQYLNGELDGPFTEYDENGSVALRGVHKHDKRVGHLQIFDEFGAILWGKVDKNQTLTGNKVTFVYPDMKCVLCGHFIDGVMKKAKCGILNNSIENDVPDVILDSTITNTVCFDPSTHDRISKSPLLVDKYEQDKVYVSASDIANAGEGVFAKKYLKENMVVSFYNGIRLSHEEVDGRDWSLNECTITLDDRVVLDVPQCYNQLDNYCATLGHKVNHLSSPNCEYTFYDHPRFGEIKAIRTLGDVSKDCELTCDYAYNHKHLSTGEDDMPSWFSKS